MQKKISIYFKLIRLLALTVVFCCVGIMANAQFTTPIDSIPGDPGTINAYTVQNLSFGTFSSTNAGGTITISSSGTRTVTNAVVAMNNGLPYQQAIFDIDVLYGSVVSLMNGPAVTLTGSNGGSMTMQIGTSNLGSPFITQVHQPARTPVSIGATLTVGNATANPPGLYSGTMYVTFNLE